MIPLVAPCITSLDRHFVAGRALSGLLDDEFEVARFEEAFADRVGCEWAVAVNSGTSALILALYALRLRERIVEIPSWSCTALRIALDDCERLVDTEWNVRRASARWLHRIESPAVLPHMFGRATAHSAKSEVIYDYTLSLGAVRHHIGLGVCSTSADKMISTGRGGLVFGNDPELHERVRRLAHYESHTDFGFSVGMSSMQAALGNSQLAQLDSFIERRRELAARYTDAFRPAGIECPDADCGSVFFRYLIAVQNPDRCVMALASKGIEAGRGVYPPLHQLAGLPDDQFPGTMQAVNSLLSVPVHPSITDEQADHIIESVKEVCAP